jgi:hypothetical protein
MDLANLRTLGTNIGCAVFSAAILCSCSLKETEIVGTYVADRGYAYEKITFGSDGTCVQEVSVPQVEHTYVARGTWRYSAKVSVVFLDGTMVLNDGLGRLPKNFAVIQPGSAAYPIQRWFGRPVLGSDQDVVFKKIQ